MKTAIILAFICVVYSNASELGNILNFIHNHNHHHVDYRYHKHGDGLTCLKRMNKICVSYTNALLSNGNFYRYLYSTDYSFFNKGYLHIPHKSQTIHTYDVNSVTHVYHGSQPIRKAIDHYYHEVDPEFHGYVAYHPSNQI